MSTKSKSAHISRDCTTILGKIFTPQEIRRFERVERVSSCTAIAAELKARHPYMTNEELDASIAELLALLVKEKVAAQMAHFYAIDEDAEQSRRTQDPVRKSFLARFRCFFGLGG